MKRLCTLFLALWLGACAHLAERAPARPPLILISIDGFRADYLNRGLTPTLAKLAAEGAVAGQGMRPSFPANTYPNHYTLVTGLRPDRHGIVHNDMEDPLIPGVTFSQKNRAAVADRRFQCWLKGEVPERFHYGHHRRVAPIVCLATTGWYLTLREWQTTPWEGIKGQHGFDPYDLAMAALFIANGPAFRRGAVVAPFDNVDVYPLLAHLLGVTPEPGDGHLDHLAGALK